MKLQIDLGWDLDGGSHPDASAPGAASLGNAVAGPLGLIDLLERHLGLGGRQTVEAERIAAQLGRMQILSKDDGFYAASFEADPWSTAKTLLGWRDTLRLGGWDGCALDDAPRRFQELAEIEAVSGPDLGQCPGERLWRVLGDLERARSVDPVGQVRLVEPVSLWPPAWRRLFTGLSKAGVNVVEATTPEGGTGGNLGTLQDYLKDGRRGCLAEDDTLVVIDAENEIEAAEATAEWLTAAAGENEENTDVVIVRGPGSGLLDSDLAARHLPRIGISERSPWRAALQVLPLVLEGFWEPFDPRQAMELLSLPHSPVWRGAAVRLARALGQEPGMGGDEWVRAWGNALAARQERFLEKDPNLDEARLSRKMERFERNLRFWLPAKRFRPEQGLPVSKAREVCSRIAQWAAAFGERGDGNLLQTASGQAETLSRVLANSGLDRVTRPILNRMLDTVIGGGALVSGIEAEAAQWRSVDRPSQIHDATGTLLWWSCVDDGEQYLPDPWSEAERRYLATAGISFEVPRARRVRQRAALQRALCGISGRLVLVVPRALAGEPAEPHMVLSDVRAALSLETPHPTLYWPAHSLKQGTDVRLAGRQVARRETTISPLPEPRRQWAIPANVLRGGERESPTGLEDMLACSFRWALGRRRLIMPSTFLSLPHENLMLGNLAHKIVERLFAERQDWDEAAARTRSTALFDELVPKMAAPLLKPGLNLERTRIRRRMIDGIGHLVRLIRSSGLSVDHVERPLERSLGDGKPLLKGKLDLQLTAQTQQSTVLDLKWSYSDRRRREELDVARPVQLAAYAWLLEPELGSGVEAGYFMLAQRQALLTAEGLMEGLSYPEVDLRQVWRSAAESYDAATAMAASGLLVATGVPAEEDPPDDALPFALEPPCRYCAYQLLCGAQADES